MYMCIYFRYKLILMMFPWLQINIHVIVISDIDNVTCCLLIANIEEYVPREISPLMYLLITSLFYPFYSS